MIGKTVSHYHILERLGGGGMGVVYKAEDTRLKRTVALKFLPPELTSEPDAKQRFIQEAQAASGLQHPNVCVVHDIDETPDGQMFIVMEHLPGETLKKKIERGPLEIDACIDIACQIAQGLAKAHANSIAHRDIKPANIVITDAGVAKIVDFGLAKLHGRTQVTRTGTTMGTAAYMSPEQVKSEAVDHRTDLWSLGAVVYEMVTGQLPFRGEHEVALSYSIVNENPVPTQERRDHVPPRLQAVISRCLEKDIGKRYQNAEEIVSDLRQLRQTPGQQAPATRRFTARHLIAGGIIVVGLASLLYILFRPTTPLHTEKSIAVLPFVDMSPEKDQEYFCDGMTEEIINRLSNLKELKVPARTSVFTYKGSRLDIREIGERLKVQTVLEGSVRKSGNRLRITAQLINVGDAFHLWSEQYDRELKDVFAIQSDVAQQIASALDAALSPAEKEQLERQATANLDAYNLYLQGRFHWRKRTPGELQQAVAYFSDAVGLDSTYALAYVGLADCYTVYPFYRVPGVSQQEAFRRAEESAKRALALDPALAEAHTSLASVRKEGYWDWVGAEQEFKRAIELDPRYGTARQWYSENLMVQGRQTEALEEAKRAFGLEPSSVIISNNLGLQYLMNRQYTEAIVSLKRTIELDPTHASPHLNIASAYFMVDAFREAAAELRFTSMPPELTTLLLTAWLDTTKREAVVKEIDSFAAKNRNMRPSILVRMYATLHQPDRTFEWLERCCASRDPELLYIIRHPSLHRFLPDPRYSAILRTMGLSAD
jgi:serine/threonine protein kinase/tetratricopeptide (TPR) repeat protein